MKCSRALEDVSKRSYFEYHTIFLSLIQEKEVLYDMLYKIVSVGMKRIGDFKSKTKGVFTSKFSFLSKKILFHK